MHQIRPGLYLGGRDDAHNIAGLKAANISHVLTIECEPLEIQHCDLKYKFVCVADLPNSDLLSHFPECIDFVEEGVKAGGVLVHCFMGVSRSTTIVVAYLMKKDKKCVDDTLKLVKKIKHNVGPNHGFMNQLRLFESMGSKRDFKDDPLYKQYKLEKVAKKVLEKRQFDEESDCLATDPVQQSEEDVAQVTYKCKMCRRAVFRGSSVIKHKVGCGPRMFRTKSGRSRAPAQISCTSLFIEPVTWMEPVLAGYIAGKLFCPKCNARLGSFNWGGDQCSCAAWITPSFQIHRSKVDETRRLPAITPTQPGLKTAQASSM